MLNVTRQQRLADLRTRIASIEKRPLLAEGAALGGGRNEAGERPALFRAPAGVLQEVYAEEQRDGGAAFGFALGLARQLITPSRPAILFLQLAHEAQEVGVPYALGLESFGLDPARLILGRLASPVELLWAAEEAIACQAVAAVVAEVLGSPRALDFTASRRLSLRAASGGASVFVLRYGAEREASAARLRWRVAAAGSQAPAFDDQAPGATRWRVCLEKGRLGEMGGETGDEFLVDWTENGFAPVIDTAPRAKRTHARPAPYGAEPAALGDRLPQAS